MGRVAAGILTLGISEAFREKKPEAPKPQPLPQAPTSEGAADKAADTIKKRKSALAGSKSIYSGPLGASGSADVVRKTLLGQ